jgi:TfoX N-terminal domain
MAYDEQLADRVREIIHIRPGVVEKKMFGGLGFMIGGNWAVGVMRSNQMVVRIEPDEVDEAIRRPHVSNFGRPGSKPMKGFVVVEPEALDEDEFAFWVERGADRAASMPPK